MNRYEQRKQKRMHNPEFAAGCRAMDAEMQLVLALEAICKHRGISQETLAERIGKKREAISRLFSSDNDGPTSETMIKLLSGFEYNSRYYATRSERG